MKIYSTEKGQVTITDAQSLQTAIQQVRDRVQYRETELKKILTQLPRETIKSGAASVLPAFLTTKAAGASASGIWNIVKLATGQKKAIFPLMGSLARAGVFAFLKHKVKAMAVIKKPVDR